MALFGFHFYTITIPTTIPWFLILLLGVILFISASSRGSKVAVLIVFPMVLLLYIPVMWWIGYGLIIGMEGDLRVHESKEMNIKTITYTHQSYWGGAQYETLIIGEDYLWGLIYKGEADTTYLTGRIFTNDLDKHIELPEGVHSDDVELVWKDHHLLIVYDNHHSGKKLYPLKYRSN